MKLYCDTRSKVDILANAFDFGSLMIVARAYAFSDDIPVSATAYEFHLIILIPTWIFSGGRYGTSAGKRRFFLALGVLPPPPSILHSFVRLLRQH